MSEAEVVEKQFNDILTTLFGESTKSQESLRYGSNNDGMVTESANDETQEESTLYDMLNAAPGSRKTMNVLFRKHNDIDLFDNCLTAKHSIKRSLLEKCVAISNAWEQDDKFCNSTIPSSATTLQLEAPVSFAWSNNNRPNSNGNKGMSSIIRAQANSNIQAFVSQKHMGEPIRQVLFKKVNENLEDLTKDLKSWNYIINGIEEVSDSDNEFGDSTVGDNSQLKSNNGSEPLFKVNPLAKFVPAELPREKKPHDDTKSHKHKSKKGTFRWRWGRSSSKHKSTHKTKKNKDEDDGDKMDITKMGHSKIPTDLSDFTAPSIEAGRGSSSESIHDTNRKSMDDFDFDLDTNSSTGTSPLEGSEFSSQANSSSVVNTNNNSHINVNSADEIDLLSDIFSAPTPFLPSTLQNVSNTTSHKITEEKVVDDDDDDDFGNFEMAGSKNKNKTNDVVNSINLREESLPITANAPPGLMSFVPLQPQKK